MEAEKADVVIGSLAQWAGLLQETDTRQRYVFYISTVELRLYIFLRNVYYYRPAHYFVLLISL